MHFQLRCLSMIFERHAAIARERREIELAEFEEGVFRDCRIGLGRALIEFCLFARGRNLSESEHRPRIIELRPSFEVARGELGIVELVKGELSKGKVGCLRSRGSLAVEEPRVVRLRLSHILGHTAAIGTGNKSTGQPLRRRRMIRHRSCSGRKDCVSRQTLY